MLRRRERSLCLDLARLRVLEECARSIPALTFKNSTEPSARRSAPPDESGQVADRRFAVVVAVLRANSLRELGASRTMWAHEEHEGGFVQHLQHGCSRHDEGIYGTGGWCDALVAAAFARMASVSAAMERIGRKEAEPVLRQEGPSAGQRDMGDSMSDCTHADAVNLVCFRYRMRACWLSGKSGTCAAIAVDLPTTQA